MEFKVGIGYDIHRLVEGRKLFLGGVEVPYIKGLLGHSDADALIHAVCDALLGSIGEKDIGEQFPDTDPRYLNACSVDLLKNVAGLVKERGYRVSNLDSVIICQEPSLLSFKQRIKERLAGILEIEIERVNVKAKTNEGMGEIGKKEAIACYAVVSLTRGE
jgi:2-C-methyl-D-erythritol 2,4-cyclodiphosphate synthase